jgi:SAM-dependent methyltransferase
MRPVKSVNKGNTPETRLAILIVMVLQMLVVCAAWSQETAQPRIDEEFKKQENIYRSRGADVPSGYVTGRALSDYAQMLPSAFCNGLAKLGNSDRWLDIGAGEGQAILDYYEIKDDALPGAKCVGSEAKAAAVAMSIEDRRTAKWREQAASLGDDRIRYLSGKRLREYSREELGKFQIITDVFGGFTYTESLSQFVEKVLSSLEIGGAFYTLVPGVHLENANDRLGILYLTELEDAAGRPEKVCSWLKKTTCTQVNCESKSEWKRPTEVITIRKVCSDVSVRRTKLVEFEAGYPPSRRFQLEP